MLLLLESQKIKLKNFKPNKRRKIKLKKGSEHLMKTFQLLEMIQLGLAEFAVTLKDTQREREQFHMLQMLLDH